MDISDEERKELIKRLAAALTRELAREELGGTPKQISKGFRDTFGPKKYKPSDNAN